jgi:hypothetical protein
LKTIIVDINTQINDDNNGNFSYFANLNNQFDSSKQDQQLFYYLKNEVEITRLNQKIIDITDRKIEIMDICKELWQLVFEEKSKDL